MANLRKHELIGLRVEVVDASDPSQEHVRGRVVDETRNMLVVDVQGEEKRYFDKLGFWPIMHVLALSAELAAREPALPAALQDMFAQAHHLSDEYFADPNWSHWISRISKSAGTVWSSRSGKAKPTRKARAGQSASRAAKIRPPVRFSRFALGRKRPSFKKGLCSGE